MIKMLDVVLAAIPNQASSGQLRGGLQHHSVVWSLFVRKDFCYGVLGLL